MTTPADIQLYKSQLDEFLNGKFVDQSLLLGFNTVVQYKFQSLIISDFNAYFEAMEAEKIPNNQLGIEFNTIALFDTLWGNFHYKIIKFFSKCHANMYNETLRDFEDSKKRPEKEEPKHKSTGKGPKIKANDQKAKDSKAGFKVRPVEMRKLNDNFLKFIKQTHTFYTGLLKYFSTHYENPLIPQRFRDSYQLFPQNASISSSSANVQANLLYIIHKCLICLGNLSRHRAFMDVSYVQPSVSNKAFFKLRFMSDKEKLMTFKPYYETALQYYKKCILLIPALNEPYNHIGMIYNLTDDKFNSCFWFLKSQFTRIPNYKLGESNLMIVLNKKWFLTNLVNILEARGRDEEAKEAIEPEHKENDIEIDKEVKKSHDYTFSLEEQLNILLVNLVGFFYLPKLYKRGPNIVKQYQFVKVEIEFHKMLSQSFESLLLLKDENSFNFFLKHFSLLFSFHKLIESSTDEETLGKFTKFTFRYIEKFVENCSNVELRPDIESSILMNMRLVFSWIKESKQVLKAFHYRKWMMKGFTEFFNKLIDHSKPDFLSQSKLTELLRTKSRPTRNYYFLEDVLFKDYSIILYQFKDFKDDHLFQNVNPNLLANDYTSCLDESGVPSILDNEKFAIVDESSRKEVIDEQILKYENELRFQSCLLMLYFLIRNNYYNLAYNFELAKFEEKTNADKYGLVVHIKDSQ